MSDSSSSDSKAGAGLRLRRTAGLRPAVHAGGLRPNIFYAGGLRPTVHAGGLRPPQHLTTLHPQQAGIGEVIVLHGAQFRTEKLPPGLELVERNAALLGAGIHHQRQRARQRAKQRTRQRQQRPAQ